MPLRIPVVPCCAFRNGQTARRNTGRPLPIKKTADSRPNTIIKAACTPFPKVQAAFCAVYQIRCSQLSTVSSIWLFKWRLSRLAKSFFSGV